MARLHEQAALDPVRMLGLRIAFLDEARRAAVANGAALDAAGVALFERRRASADAELCACTAGMRESCELPRDGELVSLVAGNRLVGAVRIRPRRPAAIGARCVFQTGVSRGGDL